MFIERVVVLLEKYKTGLKARPYVGSLGLVTFIPFLKDVGNLFVK